MRNRKRIWVLMYKNKVWVYEPLRRKEIERKKKHGWRLIE